MSGGGQTPVTQQTTQTKDPWSVSQPYLAEIMLNAQTFRGNNTGYQPFAGNTTANLQNIYTTPGFQDVYSTAIAEPQGSAALQDARAFTSDLVNNQGLS